MSVIDEIFQNSKGILAADESTGTMTKRLELIGVESTEENRRRFRTAIFATPDLEKYIGGVILYDETCRQSMPDGTNVVDYLNSRGIVPGIKVDKGAKSMPNFPGTKITEGLDGLRDRLKEYRKMGLRFTKWRAVFTTNQRSIPHPNRNANSTMLALFAALSLEEDLIPIVEPELLIDGEYDFLWVELETQAMLESLKSHLINYDVDFTKIILKTNMVMPGYKYHTQETSKKVAEATLRVLECEVPLAVAAIAFLSGGQPDDKAIENLCEINKAAPFHWHLSFSYGRALQGDALKAWAGKDENVEAAQQALLNRAKQCSEARIR